MPKSKGGARAFGHFYIRNTKTAHAFCNEQRGQADHCIGALACAVAIAGPDCARIAKIIGAWRGHFARKARDRARWWREEQRAAK